MLAVDLIVGVVIALAVAWGLVKGLATTLPLAGVAVGAMLGTRMPLLFGEDLDSTFSLVAALPAAVFLGALLAAVVERFGVRSMRRLRDHARVNAVGGAVLAGAVAVVVAWILGPTVAQIDALRDPVEGSAVLARFNAVLTPAGPNRRDQPDPARDNFPTFAGPPPKIAAADASAERDPDVKTAERSVVKVGVQGCEGSGTGSGWFASPGIIVTAAHVVDAAEEVVVRLRGRGPARKATAIWFDPANDLALLRVPALRGVRPLAIVHRPQAGTSGASLGFPGGTKDTLAARLGTTTKELRGRLGGVRGGSDLASGLGGRLVTPFRGRGSPGISGGPVVDLRGRVLTTIFAGGSKPPPTGFGVPNTFVSAALRKAGPAVSTGKCT